MTYGDVIRYNCEHIRPQWWPKYAYHFTDVTNVVSILSSGNLYSRVQADRRGIMGNDNASRQVIDMTKTQATAYARFYFRPLTPTQYYNEGFKHRDIRYCGDAYANVPVPVFLVFDLEKLLSDDSTMFSAQSQAGYGCPIRQGIEAFSQLPFEKIYSNGPCDSETLHYRHAELLYPDFYPIDDSLKMILCRNECEKATLLNLLRKDEAKTYYRYKDSIRVAREYMFQRNGLFVESAVYHDDIISFAFAQTSDKKKFDRKHASNQLSKLNVFFQFQWTNKKGLVLYSATREVFLDYLSPSSLSFTNLPTIPNAATITVTLRIDDKIICISRHPLIPYEVV